mgnify:CR=1 FL=1
MEEVIVYEEPYTEKRDSGDVFNFKTDYSDQKSWQACISKIAIAQDKIGVKSAMACVEGVVRNREDRKEGYVYCSPRQLEEALRRMRKEFIRLKVKK